MGTSRVCVCVCCTSGQSCPSHLMSAALWTAIHSGRIKCCVFVGSIDLVLVGLFGGFYPTVQDPGKCAMIPVRAGLIKAEQ